MLAAAVVATVGTVWVAVNLVAWIFILRPDHCPFNWRLFLGPWAYFASHDKR